MTLSCRGIITYVYDDGADFQFQLDDGMALSVFLSFENAATLRNSCNEVLEIRKRRMKLDETPDLN